MEQRADRLGTGVAVLLGILLAVGYLAANSWLTGVRASLASDFAYPNPGPAPALALVDQDGAPFEVGRLGGRPALVFFGYTHCPDVCPTTIGVLNDVIESYRAPLAVVFVTIDPERDTVAALHDYVGYLPAGWLALTGTATAIRTAADGYGVAYARVDSGSAGGYAMSHTANVYLIDAAGQLRARYPFGTDEAPILHDLRALDAERSARTGGNA